MWNDTDIPLAYLITFRCYGTWLHGDGRGSVDREYNCFGTPYIPPSVRWRRYNERTLKDNPVILDAGRRESVEKAIRETCDVRRWLLHALNVRTNHIHIVVSIGGAKPSSALNALKANATRQLRQDERWAHAHSPWADKGSARYLWNERSIERAVNYVVNSQGGNLPDFNADGPD